MGHLGRSNAPRTPRPGPGEGVGGGVNPSPKGKKGVGRGNSLDHLRPKGLVGFLEGCLALATQACRFSARLAAKMVSEDVHDHQGLEAIKLIAG